jgi:hypothetical protein
MKRVPPKCLPKGWSCDWEEWRECFQYLKATSYNLSSAEMTMKCLYDLPVPIRPIAYWKISYDHSYIFTAGDSGVYYYWCPDAQDLVRIEGDGLTDENVVLRRLSGGYTQIREVVDGNEKLWAMEEQQSILARQLGRQGDTASA